MSAAKLNLDMVRGDTLTFDVDLCDFPAELDRIRFSVRRREDDELVLELSLGEGITHMDSGAYKVRIAPEMTEDFDIGLDSAVFVYDLEITTGEEVYTVLKGDLIMEGDVSR